MCHRETSPHWASRSAFWAPTEVCREGSIPGMPVLEVLCIRPSSPLDLQETSPELASFCFFAFLGSLCFPLTRQKDIYLFCRGPNSREKMPTACRRHFLSWEALFQVSCFSLSSSQLLCLATLAGREAHLRVLFGCFGRNIGGFPGLPGGLIIYQGHLFALKGHLCKGPA